MEAKRERYKTGEKALTRNEYNKIKEVIDSIEEEVMIVLPVATGMRREDLANAEWSGVSEQEATLTFWERKKRKNHTVPLSPQVIQLLRKYRNSLGKNTRETILPFSGRTAHRRLQHLCDKAGVPRRPFHALRATCIKFCQSAGWSPEQVAKLTNDRISTIQEHYSTPSNSEMIEVAKEKSIV